MLTMFVTKAVFAGFLAAAAGWAQVPTRAEFEVASIKAAEPFDGRTISMFCKGGPGSSDPGLFRCENWSLANLIRWAYPLGPKAEVSVPDWAESTLFNVDARVPAGTNREQFQQMLQNLLADRFKLTVHHETQPSTEYRLIVAKGGPRFKAAGPPPPPADTDAAPAPPKPFQVDAEGYPKFEPGKGGMAAANGKARLSDPRMTMAGLSSQLGAYLHTHVNDATGLTGEYAIDLYWVMDMGPSAGSEEMSGPTLVEAVQKQLGLRLEKTANGTKDVLVIDHAEKTPSEN